MGLIPCTDPCVYQKDGCCSLSRALSSGEPGDRGCVNFVPICPQIKSKQRSQGLPDIGDSNQLQPFGNR